MKWKLLDIHRKPCYGGKYCYRRPWVSGMLSHEPHLQRTTSGDRGRGSCKQIYGNCRSLAFAQVLFAKMQQQDMFPWHFMIRVYVNSDQDTEALRLFQQMLCQGIIPDKYIIVDILSICASLKILNVGKQLHNCIAARRLGSDVVVGTALVNMYGECGNLASAQKVFEKMPSEDVESWNAMISAYIQSGHEKRAIQMFEQIHQKGAIANKATYAIILEACASQDDLMKGKRIHACIVSKGLESDLVVESALSHMYSKCSSSLEEVQRWLDGMIEQEGIPQNATITSHAQKGLIKEDLQFFERMLQEGTALDKFSFVRMIAACTSQGTLAQGQQMHVCIAGTSMETDVIVGTALVTMYGKFGRPEIARVLFDKVAVHDVVSWTAMITAYSQNGRAKDALQLFERMKHTGIKPNNVTFAIIVDVCASEVALTEGKKIHAEILGQQLELNVFVGTSLVNMYGNCGCLKDARRIFDKMRVLDVVAWNAILAAYAQNGEGAKVVEYFRKMQQEGVMPNKVTFIHAFDACAIQLALAEGKRIHAQFTWSGFECDVVGTALVNLYGKSGCVEDARRLFDKLSERDIVSWTAIIAAYAHHGQSEEAFRLFDKMRQVGIVPDKVTYVSILSACASKAALEAGRQIHTRITACGLEVDVAVHNGLISMYGKCSSMEDAKSMFDKMPVRNADTFVSILSACASQVDLAEGRQMHACAVESGFELDVGVGNALVNMYGKCGNLLEAQRVFDMIPERDVVAWTIMIASYAQHGHAECALQLFDRMQWGGLSPNNVTFVNILNACNHTGMADEGFKCFAAMSQMHNIVPLVDHYNCIIDLLGRAGRLGEAEELLRNMPFQEAIIAWTSLLGACRHHVDVERGEHAAEQLFQLEPQNPAPFLTLSNIYTAAGRGGDAAKVMKRLRDFDVSTQSTASSLQSRVMNV